MSRLFPDWTRKCAPALIGLLAMAGPAAAEKRVALVIGNSAIIISHGSTIPVMMRN